MRTNELHATAKQVQRSSGRSSVAAAAYRSAELIVDERTGIVHDYTKKGGVEFTRVYAPDNAPDWSRNRTTLWNAVEMKENRSNSCTAREFEIAFPHEFNAMQRREAGDVISREIMNRYNCAVDIAYHQPSREGDQRNFHAHILFTTRGFDPGTEDGWDKNKYRDLSNDKIEGETENGARGKAEVHDLRRFTAEEMNRIAERDGLQVRTEHLSFAARGLKKEPTRKMGWMATEMERRGEETERGGLNREINASNDNLVHTQAQLSEQRLVLVLEQKRALLALEQLQGDKFTSTTLAQFEQQQVLFFHDKHLKQSQEDLSEAKKRLENMTLIERMTGKRNVYEADIALKQDLLRKAEQELQSIRSKDILAPMPQEELNAKRIDINQSQELKHARAIQYTQEQSSLKSLQNELDKRSNIDRIIGAITGKTREQKAKIEELQQSIKIYELDQRREEIRLRQQAQLKAELEMRRRDQVRVNDNLVTKSPDEDVTRRKQEFLERMDRERSEKTAHQDLFKSNDHGKESADAKAERSLDQDIAARKQAYLDQRSALRGQIEIGSGGKEKDRERE